MAKEVILLLLLLFKEVYSLDSVACKGGTAEFSNKSDDTINCLGTNCKNCNMNCQPKRACTAICQAEDSCAGTNLSCSTTTGSCTIECRGMHSCKGAVITCPIGSTCSVLCSGYQSCSGLTILQHTGYGITYGELIIDCKTEDACIGSNISCSNKGGCDINCSDQRSCESITVTGGDGSSPLSLTCGDNSCGDSKVTCPSTGSCTVNCIDGSSSCKGMDIRGQSLQTGSLELNCISRRACVSVNVTCPLSGSCDVTCQNQESCSKNSVTCPRAGDCTVSCSGTSSCKGATWNHNRGSTSGYTDIKCGEQHACTNTILQCGVGICKRDCSAKNSCERSSVDCAAAALLRYNMLGY